jgi:hypothetical protein
MKSWDKVDDDGFDYQSFFDTIMSLFRDDNSLDSKDPWVKETLSWWNK